MLDKHLWIGVLVASFDEAGEILSRFGVEAPAGEGEDWFDGRGVAREVSYKGAHHRVFLCGSYEHPHRIVGFQLTGRYKAVVLDQGHKGMPNPFVVDVEGLSAILAEVRQWWPEAQVLLFEVDY